ncbi:MAG: helix-turn-helix transcriptional regulator [Gammaproteobacteria bacterium]
MDMKLQQTEPPLLTLEKANAIINQDIGFYGLKDLDGKILNCTTASLGYLSAKNFKYREEAFDQIEYDLCINKNYVDIYRQNDQLTYSKKANYCIEPILINKRHTYTIAHKLPVYNQECDQIIASIYRAIVIDHDYLINFFDHLQQHQRILNAECPAFFEILPKKQPHDLTSRESECLFYTLRGKTAKDIARLLAISPKTVEFHMEHLKAKFGCYNKSELIAKAIDLGYLNKIPASILSLE